MWSGRARRARHEPPETPEGNSSPARAGRYRPAYASLAASGTDLSVDGDQGHRAHVRGAGPQGLRAAADRTCRGGELTMASLRLRNGKVRIEIRRAGQPVRWAAIDVRHAFMTALFEE